MHTSVTFKNLDASEALRAYAEEKLNRFDKYLDNPAEANVVLVVEKFRHIAEINIVGDRLSINGKEETVDMYSAIDKVLDKLEKQIKKSKEKVRERRATTKSRIKERGPEAAEPEAEETSPSAGRIRIENIEYKPMDVEEAVLQMDLLTDSFLVFTNARTEQVNVLYRRKNGDYGLIQPSS